MLLQKDLSEIWQIVIQKYITDTETVFIWVNRVGIAKDYYNTLQNSKTK